MEKNKVDFRTSGYFPSGMLLAGVVFILGGLLVAIAAKIFLGIVIILAGITILTTHYRLEIDFESKRYRDYVWFLGLKNGKPEKFEKIEYLFINQSRLSQNLNSRISTRAITKDVFNGYLKLDGEETIHLLSKENKAALVQRLNKIADLLKVKVIDYAADQ